MLDRTTWQPTPTRSPNTHACFQHTNQAPRQSHRLVLVRGSVRTSDGASAVRACTKGLHKNFSCFAHRCARFSVWGRTHNDTRAGPLFLRLRLVTVASVCHIH